MTDKKSIAIVFVGLPASGKSTMITKLADFMKDAFVYSTDQYIEDVAKENGSTYNATFDAEIDHATKYMNEKLAEAVANNVPIIWDQTNMTDKKRKKIIHKLEKRYEVKCICILPPQNKQEEEDYMYRLTHREGKTIPDYVIDKMLESFVVPSISEGFDYVSFYNIYGKSLNFKKRDE